MKNTLSGSKAVKGTETYEQFDTRIDTLLQNYKVQATKIILEVIHFEVEQKKKKLISKVNDCVSYLANTLTIVKLETKKWLTGIKSKEIAAHAALKMYKTLLSDTFFTLLTAERDEITASLKLEHMKDSIREISELPYDQGYEDAQIILKTALSFTNTLPNLTLQVWAGKVKKEPEKKVSMILKEFLEKKNQGKSNEDIMMAVEEESAEKPSSIIGIFEKRISEENRRHKAHIDQVTQAFKRERPKKVFRPKTGRPTIQIHREWIPAKQEIKKWNPANQHSRAPRP